MEENPGKREANDSDTDIPMRKVAAKDQIQNNPKRIILGVMPLGV